MESVMPKLLLATGNSHKVREFLSLLRGVSFQLTTPAWEGLNVTVTEVGVSMEENARLKATTYGTRSGLLTLADDSGLEVEALGGGPGILSARCAGENASDEEKIEYLLTQLKGIPDGRRTACFCCVIAIATPQGKVRLCRGECQGFILTEPRGSYGFGYDPVFYLPELDKTMAELTLKEKNKVSHRGKAAQRARRILESIGVTREGDN